MRILHILVISLFLFLKKKNLSHFNCHNARSHSGYTVSTWFEWIFTGLDVFVHALSIRVYKINRIIVRHIIFRVIYDLLPNKWYQTNTPRDEIKRSARMHKNHQRSINTCLTRKLCAAHKQFSRKHSLKCTMWVCLRVYPLTFSVHSTHLHNHTFYIKQKKICSPENDR